jgi:hypothetical protein
MWLLWLFWIEVVAFSGFIAWTTWLRFGAPPRPAVLWALLILYLIAFCYGTYGCLRFARRRWQAVRQ